MAKYVKVGQIIENTTKDGKKYEQLVLNAEFLKDAKNLLQHAYLDKKGGRRFSLFKPRAAEGKETPSWLKMDVVVKVEE